MKLPKALLEGWMREYYFDTDFDIGSSGVANYSLGDLRRMLGIEVEDLDNILFHDSETLGGGGLRQALANRWTGGDAGRVMVTHGSTEANFMIMTTLIEPGDEVVVLDPFYQQLYAIAEGRGCVLKRWHMRWENGFRPDLAELKALVSPKTRMIVVNFPHNPTGVSLRPSELEALVEVSRRVGAYLVWDAAFSDLVYESEPLPDPVMDYDKAISMGTLSKAYGLPGLRVGWCLAPKEVLEHFVHLRDYTILHLSPLVELLAQKAIENAEILIGKRLSEAKENLEVLASWIAENGDHVSWVRPDGGVCAFVRFREGIDVDALCRSLAEDRVLLVPGSCFGQPAHARLGFGGSREELEGGLQILAKHLAKVPAAQVPAGA